MYDHPPPQSVDKSNYANCSSKKVYIFHFFVTVVIAIPTNRVSSYIKLAFGSSTNCVLVNSL